jgi:hypothetical protein
MPSSLSAQRHQLAPRDVKDVPFVELYDQRLQGVVSSGSDVQRVYVSFFVAGSLNYSCSTNNNRPCGGLRGSPCHHLRALLDEAIAQFGIERVVRFLRPPGDPARYQQVAQLARHAGQQVNDPAGTIFSRFLMHLALLELAPHDQPLPTLAWF